MPQLHSLSLTTIYMPNSLKLAAFINLLGRFPNLRALRIGELFSGGLRELGELKELHIGCVRCAKGDAIWKNRQDWWERGMYLDNNRDTANIDHPNNSLPLTVLLSSLIHKLSPNLHSLHIGSVSPSSLLSSSIVNSIDEIVEIGMYRMVSPKFLSELSKCIHLRELDLHVSEESSRDAHLSPQCVRNLIFLRLYFQSTAPLFVAPSHLERLHLYFSREFSFQNLNRFQNLKELRLFGVFDFCNEHLLTALSRIAGTLTHLSLCRSDQCSNPVALASHPPLQFIGKIVNTLQKLTQLREFIVRCHTIDAQLFRILGEANFSFLTQLHLHVYSMVDVYPKGGKIDEELEHSCALLATNHVCTLPVKSLTIGDNDPYKSKISFPYLFSCVPDLRYLQWNVNEASLEALPDSTALVNISSITIHCCSVRDLRLKPYPELTCFALYVSEQPFLFSLLEIVHLVYTARKCHEFCLSLIECGQSLQFENNSIKERLELFISMLEQQSEEKCDWISREDDALLQPYRDVSEEWNNLDDAEIRAHYSLSTLCDTSVAASYNWLLREFLVW
eukprot:CAMPEP_0117452482 /NCGR_PEP_ID=MMETSP0759-20121206/9644_1 /TAXON_ID=63605 /ORGANISM="Percolomonas cosmopolitus, Strain WS" /LENGTH=561 /DNA_ID=CAMNT_0005245311 /DNA_START=381 /DNA_END=2064 /DNA_ORIENTATION=-